jgi:hypothetical protein
MVGLALKYYAQLRSVLRSDPLLRRCLKRCRHCRIFFLSVPANDKRTDLRCPFGCREHHRRQCSTQRSADYYRSPKGRERKRALNRKRYLVVPADATEEQTAIEGEPEAESVDEPFVGYLRGVISLVEGRRVGREEFKGLLETISRQHRLWRRPRFGYLVEQLNKDPP